MDESQKNFTGFPAKLQKGAERMAYETSELLKEEYFSLRTRIHELDQIGITIKKWSATSALTAVGIAYWRETPQLLMAAGLAAFMFWVLDGIWKLFQQAHLVRVEKIEEYFRGKADGGDATLAALQIHTSWFERLYSYGIPAVRKQNELKFNGSNWPPIWLTYFFYMGVMLPHVLITVLSLTLYFFFPPKPPMTAEEVFPIVEKISAVSYTYEAELVEVIDGDSVVLNVDLGFDHWLRNQRFRLWEIDAPEGRTKEGEIKVRGKAATKWLKEKIADKQLVVQSIENELHDSDEHNSFGRWLAILFVDGEDLNEAMKEAGHTIPNKK